MEQIKFNLHTVDPPVLSVLRRVIRPNGTTKLAERKYAPRRKTKENK